MLPCLMCLIVWYQISTIRTVLLPFRDGLLELQEFLQKLASCNHFTATIFGFLSEPVLAEAARNNFHRAVDVGPFASATSTWSTTCAFHVAGIPVIVPLCEIEVSSVVERRSEAWYW